MSTLLVETPVRDRSLPTTRPFRKVIRVSAGENFLGEIHLDGRDRVYRRADSVPPDVVLKVLVRHTRQGDSCGLAQGRGGQTFHWYVVGPAGPG